MIRMRWISLFSLFSIALAGCGVSQVKAENAPTLMPTSNLKENESITTPPPAVPTQMDDMPKDPPLLAMPTQMDDMPKDPPLPIPRSLGLEVLIERAKADLAQKFSVPASQIKAIETKEAVWPDASLGCPQPGIVFAQIPTPGYIIMLEYAGDDFEYHASIRGDILYCENPTPSISGTPADNYPFK